MLAWVRGGKSAKGYKTHAYLLCSLRVEQRNQIWWVNITCLPMRRGFLYLVAAIMGWQNQTLLAWGISNTPDANFCVDTRNKAIYRFGPPDIMNSDKGSQFTSFAWIDRLCLFGIRISPS
jgi:putative transposase